MVTPARIRLHRGLVGLAVLAAATCGAAVLAAAPAYAGSTLTVAASPSSMNMTVGGDDQTLSISVTTDQPATNASASVSIPLASEGVTAASTSGATCNMGDSSLDCSLGTLTPGTTMTFTVTLRPPGETNSISPGQSQNGSGTVTVNADRATAGSATYAVTLTNDQPDSVGSISGSVVNGATGAGVSGATVTLTDSSNHTQTATTDSSGDFSWTPSDTQTLAPGTITASVQADGFASKSASQSGQAGQPLTFSPISLTKNAASHKPSPSPRHQAASPTAQASGSGGGLGWVTWLLVILGSLLVIGGVVAIVFLLRKKDDDDEGPDDGEQGPLLPYGSGGNSPYGYPQNAGATSVMPSVPGGDAPTMVHNGPLVPGDDRPTSVYGTPTQQYGAPTQQYGGATQSWQQGPATYGGGSGYPAPSSGAPSGYPAPSSGAPSGYPAPSSGAPAGGPGYLTPNGTYGAPPPSSQSRPEINDPTRSWQAQQQSPPPPQPRQQPMARPSGDETRLDRSDGVDWLEG